MGFARRISQRNRSLFLLFNGNGTKELRTTEYIKHLHSDSLYTTTLPAAVLCCLGGGGGGDRGDLEDHSSSLVYCKCRQGSPSTRRGPDEKLHPTPTIVPLSMSFKPKLQGASVGQLPRNPHALVAPHPKCCGRLSARLVSKSPQVGRSVWS